MTVIGEESKYEESKTKRLSFSSSLYQGSATASIQSPFH